MPEEKIGRLWVELDAQSGNFLKKLDEAEKKFAKTKEAAEKIGASVEAVGRSFAIFGAAVTASMGLAVKSWADAGDQANKMAQRTGFSVVALQELRYAASQTGTSIEEMEIGFKRMSAVLQEASNGSSTANKALAQLGITYDQLAGKKPEEQFNLIAKQLGGIQDPTMKAALAMDIFGRSGTALLPLLAEGSDGLQQLREDAHKYGLVLDQEGAEAATRFGDDLDNLKATFKALWQEVAIAVIPTLNKLISGAQNAMLGMRKWKSENEGLFSAISKGALAIGALALALGSILIPLGKLIQLFPAIRTAITFLAANPAVIGVAALSAAIIYLATHLDDLKFGLMSIGRALVAFFLEAAAVLLGALESVLSRIPYVGDGIKKAHEKILSALEANAKGFEDTMAEYQKKKAAESIETTRTTEKTKADITKQAAIDAALAKIKADEDALAAKKKAEEEAQRLLDNRIADTAKKIREELSDKQAVLAEEEKWALEHAESLGLKIDMIREYYARKQMEREAAAAEKMLQNFQQILGQVTAIYSQAFANRSAELDIWAEKERQTIEGGALSEEAKAKALVDLDKKVASERRKLAREQAENQKKLAIVAAIINTAEAVTKALATGNVPLAVLIGGLGAAQIDLISKQPIPSLKEGGLAKSDTLAMVGDYAGSMTNPEVISPLNKLKDIIGSGEQNISIYLDGKQITHAVVKGMPRELKLLGVA